jgi:hypothetical protein
VRVSALRELGQGLWVHETPLRFAGLEVGRRMNVVRLGGGELLIHSPARLEPELRAELDALGPVSFVVAPTCLHGHLWMEQYAAAYPSIELHAPPRLRKRRKDLTFAGDLGDEPDPRWATDLDQVLVRGSRAMPEVVFLHRPTRSLLVGDLAMSFGADSAPATRAMARLGGMYERLRPTPLYRAMFRRRERAATRESLERVLAWDFGRVVTGHGQIVESGGRESLKEAYAWAWR